MIIGLDTSAAGKKTTGTSTYIECCITELQKTEHTIKLFSPVQLEFNSNTSFLNSIPVIKRGGIRRHLFRTFELAKLMNTAKVDCGIFPNYLMPLNFKKQSAIIIHDLSFISHPQFYSSLFVKYYTNRLKRIIQKKPLIITISKYSKESINKYLGVDKNEIYLLQGYISERKINCNYTFENASDTRPYFLYVGHIEPRKNLIFLIKYFLEWKSENNYDYKLKLAGEIWSASKEIRLLLNRYSSHPDIEFTGYVSEERLHQLYSGASGFVHASIVEGFGFPVLEAMKYGLPVLCSSGSGTEEISNPLSIIFNPFNGLDLKKGFNRLVSKVQESPIDYSIKYSSKLMREQLEIILDAMERKIKSN